MLSRPIVLRLLAGCAAGVVFQCVAITSENSTTANAAPHWTRPASQESNVNSESPFIIRIDTSKPNLHVFVRGRLYRAYPVALGKVDSETPIGSWRIVDKQKGWGSGFGTRWLGLNVPWGIYGIHGTNRPESIGRFASHGCIRMLNQDVEALYDLVPVGTPVIVIGDPLKHLRVLVEGNTGADVQLVQTRLKRAGFYRGLCHGKFDLGTQFALLYFELSRGIPMDGVVGRDDYEALGLTPGRFKE